MAVSGCTAAPGGTGVRAEEASAEAPGGVCLGYPKHTWRKSPRARVAEKQWQEAAVKAGRGPACGGAAGHGEESRFHSQWNRGPQDTSEPA